MHEHPLLRKLPPFTSAAVIIALLYVGWTFFSRWQEGRSLKEDPARQQAEDARKTIQAYGNGRVKIMNFTISPGVVGHGEKVSICYGVSDAKTVAIDPKPHGGGWPSFAPCVEPRPKKTTTHTFTANDAPSHPDQGNVTNQVQK